MELFRFANGISSEDLMTQNAQNTPMAFHGSMWRFKNAKVNQKVRAEAQTPQQSPPDQESVGGRLDAKNHLVQEAQRLGYHINPDSITQTETTPPADDQGQGHSSPPATDESGLLTKEALENMPIEEIKSFAAAVGVVNLGQKKDKLIKAILEKQHA